ncbi:MAG: 16S rRNA (uracil(1498)-N(3))-methyltransferase [Lentisphaeria bacterium]|nr:16S rRNA (uracil(1498)-N(3))-methyltransferase [Lentisphaeria bacterium]
MHAFRFDDLASTESGSFFRLDPREEAHLFRILRARPGETVAVMDGHGTAGTAVIETDHRLRLESKRTVPPPERRLHLYFAPPKKQKLDVLLKQAVELGVWELVPVLCERSVVQPDEKSVAGRWMDLLFEACKQSGNPFLPAVANPIPFEAALARARETCGALVVGSNRTGVFPDLGEAADVAFFVGPEGGFTDAESDAMSAAGAVPLRIGDWTLRVETAAVAGLGVLNVLLAPRP